MNDMEWSGPGRPDGPFTAGAVPVGPPGAVAEEDEIDILRSLFWDYVKDLRTHQVELQAQRAGEIDAARLKKAMDTAKTVREAVQLLMAERTKVEKLRKDIAGGVGGGSLDLDAARDEIGRRLACLRRAGGS